MNIGAERFNGLMVMLSIVEGFGAYATTSQLIPDLFCFHNSVTQQLVKSISLPSY